MDQSIIYKSNNFYAIVLNVDDLGEVKKKNLQKEEETKEKER